VPRRWPMPEVALGGCRPDLLASYLKALGVLRLVAEQEDAEALGWWTGDHFVLASRLAAEELVRFFEERYRPTPILAPWNKDSGFYRRGSAVDLIAASDTPRVTEYRRAIQVARELMGQFGWREEPAKAEKGAFIAHLRSRLPDASVRWLDVVAALPVENPVWAPLFVAGGADGRFEFTGAFAELVVAALGLTHRRRPSGRGRASGVRAALLGDAEPGVAVEATGGALVPESTEAPNATAGFKGGKRVNPWEYILAMEGTLLLAGAVSRRYGSPGRQGSFREATFPFSVATANSGHPSAGDENSRGELWLPVWDRPMGLAELAHLFREARAEWRGRPATTAADMARAIVSLGVDRGLSAFWRFGVQGRSGRSHLVACLGRWPVVWRTEAEVLGEIDEPLEHLRDLARQRDAPRPLVDGLRRLEGAILEYAARGGRERLLGVLLSVAAVELILPRLLARRPKLRARVPPLPGLSPRWVRECDDGSLEFALAAAIASLRPGEDGRGPGWFRQHLEPVQHQGRTWAWLEDGGHGVVWRRRGALAELAAVLERRLVDAQREGVLPPLDGRVRAHPSEVAALIDGEVDLERLARLVEALALVDWRQSVPPLPARPRSSSITPDAYAVLKLAVLGRPLRLGSQEVKIKPDLTILALLRAGRVWEGTVRAAGRLRGVGLTPRGVARHAGPPPVRPDPDLGRRLLAALLVPVWERPLVARVLQLEEEIEIDTDELTEGVRS
jgi:CRISPR-associated protein Csx17